MSFGISGAMLLAGGVGLGTAAIGAYGANKAAKQNTKGVEKGLEQSAELANQARKDVVTLFDSSSKKANIGLQSALDFYKQNAQKRMQPFMQGNQAAQNVIGLGAQQANNAILGLPVDMSFTNQPQVQADYSGIQGATLPAVSSGYYQDSSGQIQTSPAPQGGIMGPSHAGLSEAESRALTDATAKGITGSLREQIGRAGVMR